ncbi:hypothetical protein H633G_11354 [Metarhizium anisopliae BRIP 53284]|nr:hypothetical protein H633G_11354 [Metarhizium anisopliae BRIP 53284]
MPIIAFDGIAGFALSNLSQVNRLSPLYQDDRKRSTSFTCPAPGRARILMVWRMHFTWNAMTLLASPLQGSQP